MLGEIRGRQLLGDQKFFSAIDVMFSIPFPGGCRRLCPRFMLIPFPYVSTVF
jgi:hypothetical protein